jgi:formylglycine-generating enzyme required for sulfatase activity
MEFELNPDKAAINLSRHILDELNIASDELAYQLSKSHDIFSFETVNIDRYGKLINCNHKKVFYYAENIDDNVVMDMIYIPAGSFMMGSNVESHEQPIHQVTLKSFYIAKYPTTQAQYTAIMGDNPSQFEDNDLCPVDCVSWDNAMEFCQRVSKMTGKNYTLPSESQWEYACRCGTITPFYCGETITTDLANYDGDSCGNVYENCVYGDGPSGVDLEEPTPVGKYPPNPWGLYDLHGNVWEWCLDNWHSDYTCVPIDGSAWVDSTSGYHVYRGGCWRNVPSDCRSSSRWSDFHRYHDTNYGFRLCCLP